MPKRPFLDPDYVAMYGDGVQNASYHRVLNGDHGMDRAMSITEEGEKRDQIKKTKRLLTDQMYVLQQGIRELNAEGEHGTCLFLVINLCCGHANENFSPPSSLSYLWLKSKRKEQGGDGGEGSTR